MRCTYPNATRANSQGQGQSVLSNRRFPRYDLYQGWYKVRFCCCHRRIRCQICRSERATWKRIDFFAHCAICLIEWWNAYCSRCYHCNIPGNIILVNVININPYAVITVCHINSELRFEIPVQNVGVVEIYHCCFSFHKVEHRVLPKNHTGGVFYEEVSHYFASDIFRKNLRGKKFHWAGRKKTDTFIDMEHIRNRLCVNP